MILDVENLESKPYLVFREISYIDKFFYAVTISVVKIKYKISKYDMLFHVNVPLLMYAL